MRVALAQILSGPDPAANLDLVAAEIDWAAAGKADLLVLPEATMCAFGHPLRAIAEPLDGPWAGQVRTLAAAAGLVVVVGMFTPAGSRVHNTLLVTGPGVDAGYDKIHLYDAYGFAESRTVAPGTALVTVPVGGMTVGVATCYDVRFPGLFTALAERGAQVICLPASWGAGPGKAEQWDVLIRARALDSTSYVVAAGQADPRSVGREPHPTAPTGIGRSAVVDPWGVAVATLGAAPGHLFADLDPAVVAAARAALPVLVGRRW